MMKTNKVVRVAAMVALVALGHVAGATQFFVDCQDGDDGFDGKSASQPKKTIQAAINAAANGDSINVAPGLYGPISTQNKAITLIGESYYGMPVIDGGNAGRCADLGSGPSQTSTILRYMCLRNGFVSGSNGGGVRGGQLYGCTIENCHAYGSSTAGGAGGGAYGSRVSNCSFYDNSASRGGAIAECRVDRCHFVDNMADDDGAAAYHSEIYNSLIDANVANSGDICGASNTCVNCTIVNNYAADGGVAGETSMLANCIVWNNETVESGAGDGVNTESCFIDALDGDPCFKDPNLGDYGLMPYSPCVDAGANEWVNSEFSGDFMGVRRILSGVVDIGCCECDTRWPDPEIKDCAAAQEVIDVLSDGSVSATILNCMGDIATFTNGISAGLPFDAGICLDTGSRNVFARTSNTDPDLVEVVKQVNTNFTIGGHVSLFEFTTVATSELLSFHYAYASSEFDQGSQFSDPFALLVSVNGSEYENLAKLDNGMPVSIKNLRAGRNMTQNDEGDRTYNVSSTEYFSYWSTSCGLPYVWGDDVIDGFEGGHPVDGITVEFCAEKAVSIGDCIKLKFIIADTGDSNYDSFVFIKADSLGFAEIAGAPIADPATDVSKSGFVCNWHKVTGAVSYQVDVAADPDFKNLLPGCNGAEATDNEFRVDGNFPEDGVYYYRVRAVGGKGTVSVNSNVITVEIPTTEVAAPTISPDGCEFTGSIGVTIANNHPGATLYYSTDGMNPTIYSSTIASGGSITLTTNTVVKAIAVYKGVSSPVASQTYSLPPPVTPPSAVLNVQASDGTVNDGVLVTWSAPATSSAPILAYEVSRKPKSTSTEGWTVLSSYGTDVSFFDSSAQPGVDYTYRVRARNSSGWGDYGSDNGWRAVSLALAPTSLAFDYAAASKSVTVTANAAWTISGTTGCASATSGSGSIAVSVSQNGTLSPRNGSVTVTAGAGTAHPVSATVSVSQGKRPAMLTKLEITGGDTSLEGGEGTSFNAIATFDDGTTRDVTTEATWSITSGGKYGSVGAHTGELSTYATTDIGAGLTVSASYSNSDYAPVTKSDSVDVAIAFSAFLCRPVSLVVTGAGTGEIGVLQQYVATVAYNDGTTADKTLDAATVWTVDPPAPFAEIAKGASAAELVPRSGGQTLTVRAEYGETVAKLVGGGTEVVKLSGTLSVAVAAPIPLPVAVDVESPGGAKTCDLEISTSSSVNGNVWYGQQGVSHDGEDAGQSGYLAGAGANTMSTVVTNAGTISFWWKVSSEPVHDKLSFSVDGVVLAQISGSTEWSQLSFPIKGGVHALAWEYSKNAENDAGLDAGWVDQVKWTVLAPPGAPGVSATDGSMMDGVEVTWTVPSSERDITGYEVSRSENGTDWTVLTNGVSGTAWTDLSATPGVDYAYRVRAQNDAGFGEPGEDGGWCAISLVVNPDSLLFDYAASTQDVHVASSAPWTISGDADWIGAEADGTSGAKVSVSESPSRDARSSTVTVTAGTGAHATNVVVVVAQNGVPPKLNVGFARPEEDWRTRMQISTNTTPDTCYAPISVFLAGDPLDISFGWTNRGDIAVSVPPVRFKLYKPTATGSACIYEWVAPGRAGETLDVGHVAWSGHWPCNVLKTLKPGDYMIQAEIAPSGICDDIDSSDNFAVFRFAVRDPALDADKDAFPSASGWMNLEFNEGNDFAQAPHLAIREGADGTRSTTVQFGPYVPMNGKSGRTSNVKKPLDLVILLDYTGSMGGCIAGLVNNIGIFIDQLFLGDPSKGIDPIADLRVKIVGFNDTQNYTSKDWLWEGDFTSDRTELKSDLAYLRSVCGYGSGNGGESCYDALYYICKGWTPENPRKKDSPHKDTSPERQFRGTNVASRAVIMFTDEPPLMPFNKSYYKTLASDSSANNESHCMDILSAALMEANVNLTIVNDGYCYKNTSPYKENYPRFANLVNRDPTMRELIEFGGYHGALATFAGDADLLRGLATNVSSKVAVDVKVVEPSFAANVRGGGTLSFDWNNDSTAETNNTFFFSCEGVTNVQNKAGSGWQHVELELGEGVHFFKWSYGKLGYDGAVTDCGVLANATWDPWKTELEVEPLRVDVDWDGIPITQTNDGDTVVFEVTCNSIWKVVDYPTNWVTVVQGAGNGDGMVVLSVHTNMNYDAERTGMITVRAGEYGLPSDKVLGTPEKRVSVVQKPHPYIYDDQVHILSVDVKPRWPWSRKVDIDFLVQTPEVSNTPVRVKFWGLNKEGGDLVNDATYPTLNCLKKCPAGKYVNNNCWQGISSKERKGAQDLASWDSEQAYITCPTSGLYRFTWDMAEDWYKHAMWASGETRLGGGQPSNFYIWQNKSFHSPAFTVELKAYTEDGAKHCVYVPETMVRVDMRLQDDLSQGADPLEPRTLGTPSGGNILTGVEKLGHPWGLVDPIVTNTADRTLFSSNGWNSLDFIEDLDSNFSNRYHFACVINDSNVSIEGGVINVSTNWTADKVHVIRDNVFVAPGATLTIEDGAVLKFCQCSRIFIHENASEPAKTEQRHNIVVKGASFTYGYDDSYNGDTLYHSNMRTDNSWLTAGGGAIVYSQSNTNEVEEILYQASMNAEHCAITKVELVEVHYPTNGVKPITNPTWKERYYSYGQTWGDLPRPSETNCAFYGWYTETPAAGNGVNYMGSSMLYPDHYDNYQKRYRLALANMPYSSSGPSKRVKKIYALVCNTNSMGSAALPTPKNAQSGTIGLDHYSAIYDGELHKPKVTSVWVDGEDVTSSKVGDNIGGGFVAVGDYEINVMLSSDYTNSPQSATFTILPRPTEGGRIAFMHGGVEVTELKYERSFKDQIDQELLAKVVIDGMSDSVLANDFSVTWGDTSNWPRPGSYFAVAAPKAERAVNYAGPTITNWFTVTVNEDFLYTECTTESEALSQIGSKPKTADNAHDRRILYIGGREIAGDEDPVTAWIKQQIRDDFDLNDYVVDNFACWAENVAADETPRYADGLTDPEMPIVAVVSAKDTSRFVVRHAGYITAEELLAFLKSALAMPEDASSATLELSKTSFTYTGAVQRPAVTVTYAGAVMPAANYSLEWTGDCTTAGTHGVKAVFSGAAYTGETAMSEFSIVPMPVGSAVVELDSYQAETTAGKEPESPIMPLVISVHDASRTYVAGYEYDVSWGDGSYKTAGVYTVTATFKGNYSGVATAEFTIVEVSPDEPEPMVDLAKGVSVEVKAASKEEAIGSVLVGVPDGVGVDVDAYQQYFVVTAVEKPGEDGVYTVTAELDPEVVLPEDDPGDNGKAIVEMVLDESSGSVEIKAVPGLYYTLMGAATLNQSDFSGTPVLSTGTSVELVKPKIDGNAAFFMLRVGTTLK